MKKLLFLFFLLLSFEKVSCQDCCPPPDDILPCYDADYLCEAPHGWIHAIKEIHLDQYPDCRIAVSYCYRDCNNQYYHRVQYYICDITYWPHLASCTCYLDSYLDVNQDPTTYAEHYKAFRELVRMELVKEEFYVMYNSLSEEQKSDYYCPMDVGNNTPDWSHVRYKVHFFKGVCASYCHCLINDSGTEKIVLKEKSCSPSFCCKEEIQFCIDPNTGELWMLRSYSQDAVPDCPGRTPDICTDCLERVQTGCQSNCQAGE